MIVPARPFQQSQTGVMTRPKNAGWIPVVRPSAGCEFRLLFIQGIGKKAGARGRCGEVNLRGYLAFCGENASEIELRSFERAGGVCSEFSGWGFCWACSTRSR